MSHKIRELDNIDSLILKCLPVEKLATTSSPQYSQIINKLVDQANKLISDLNTEVNRLLDEEQEESFDTNTLTVEKIKLSCEAAVEVKKTFEQLILDINELETKYSKMYHHLEELAQKELNSKKDKVIEFLTRTQKELKSIKLKPEYATLAKNRRTGFSVTLDNIIKNIAQFFGIKLGKIALFEGKSSVDKIFKAGIGSIEKHIIESNKKLNCSFPKYTSNNRNARTLQVYTQEEILDRLLEIIKKDEDEDNKAMPRSAYWRELLEDKLGKKRLVSQEDLQEEKKNWESEYSEKASFHDYLLVCCDFKKENDNYYEIEFVEINKENIEKFITSLDQEEVNKLFVDSLEEKDLILKYKNLESTNQVTMGY